jgi:hypothetical protein
MKNVKLLALGAHWQENALAFLLYSVCGTKVGAMHFLI